MAPRKKTSTPPIPLEVHILALADRHAHPYASVAPKYAFTLKLVPDTTISEVCTHAGGFLSLHFNKFVDSTRLEARDGDGFVFGGKEPIGQELGAGGRVYLIEEAIDVQEAKKKLLRNLDLPPGKGARTPKAKRVKEPRKTPSQRNLEIAQQGARSAKTEPRRTPLQASQARRVVRSEPRRRTALLAPLELEDRPSSSAPMQSSPEVQRQQDASAPVVESIEDSLPVTALEKRRRSANQLAQDTDASEPNVESIAGSPPSISPARSHKSTSRPPKVQDASGVLAQAIKNGSSTTKQTHRRNSTSQPATAEDVDASVPPVASQHKLPPPISQASFSSQDERVIPDSQDPSSQSLDASPQQDSMVTTWKPINAPKASAEVQPRSAPRTKASKVQALVDAQDRVKQKQPDPLLSKPDPYDISAVLSDDEYYSPRQSNTIMSSSIRKLGSATKRTAPASSSIPRNSLLIARQSLAEDSKSPVRTKPAATTSQDAANVPSTPLARAPPNTPTRTGPSSAPGPLLSSPTDHVAAALARGRAKARRQPYLECVVIEESDDEVDEDVLIDAPNRFSTPQQKSQSSEASLPWSAPPLRMRGDDPFWTLRATGRRTSMGGESAVDGESTKVRRGESMDVERQIAVPALTSDVLEPQTLPTSGIPSFNLGSPVKDPTKRALQASARRSPARTPVKSPPQVTALKSPVLLVHGSSSSEQGVEEIGYVDKTLPSSQPASPLKTNKTVVTRGSSNLDKSEDESEAPTFKTGASQADKLFGDEKPLEPRQLLPNEDIYALDFPDDDNETCLPAIDKLPPLILAPSEEHIQPHDKPPQGTGVPGPDPKSDNVVNNTPPSGQPPKRKRALSDDLDSEEERRAQKKARHEARAAKKAERKRLREQKRAQEEERRRQQQALLQEERKRLALEKAYQRALELEIVVSSPTKAAEMGLLSDAGDSDQESELGSSPPVRAPVPPVLEGSDDSLESKESDEWPSWRKLSKRHFSASPSPSQENGAADGLTASPAPTTMGATAVEGAGDVLAEPEAEVPQGVGATQEVVEQSQRRVFDNWAFMEATLGAFAYSPLQIHNRIHMQMVQANLQGKASLIQQEDVAIAPSEKLGSDGIGNELDDSQHETVVSRRDAMARGPSVDPQELKSAEHEDEGEVSQHTIGSPAPSPKNLTAVPAQALQENSGIKRHTSNQSRGQRRKSKDNARKKRWRQKERPGLNKEIKRKHAVWKKNGKQ